MDGLDDKSPIGRMLMILLACPIGSGDFAGWFVSLSFEIERSIMAETELAVVSSSSSSASSARGGPKEVELAVLKYRIVDINVNLCTFTAVFSLHGRWYDPTLTAEDKARSKAWQSDWEPSWQPRLDFLNETEAVDRFRHNYDTDEMGFVRYFARFRGTFYEVRVPTAFC